MVRFHGVFVVLSRVTAVLQGLRLTTRDVILGGFFMEGARKNKARHPGSYSSIR